MAKFKKKGDKNQYDFSDQKCIGRACWCPGLFNHYGTSLDGARSSTYQTPECINRAYHGCDKANNPFKCELETKRKQEGWKRIY